ncbi:MAG: FHA domain-containing protein [Planctomycetota bacterium]
MELYEKISTFIENYGNLDRNVFLARFDNPFLVINIPITAGSSVDTSALGTSPKADSRTVLSEEEKKSGPLLTLVAEVAKSDHDATGGLIAVGRAQESDVVLPNRSISRHHANFYLEKNSGSASIEDVGSSYGTVVDGQPLAPGKTLPLKSGTTIIFAKSIQCTFLYPNEFYDYIQALARLRRG